MATEAERHVRPAGRGYRAKIRTLAQLGMQVSEIARELRIRPSEVALTLATPVTRGRPRKPGSVRSVADVKRWRATKRPRTLRAAVECIDFLLRVIEAGAADNDGAEPRRLIV